LGAAAWRWAPPRSGTPPHPAATAPTAASQRFGAGTPCEKEIDKSANTGPNPPPPSLLTLEKLSVAARSEARSIHDLLVRALSPAGISEV
jgi:hypothetical protein